MAAFEAQPEVYPGVPYLQAILASIGARRHLPNLIQMCTLRLHSVSLLFLYFAFVLYAKRTVSPRLAYYTMSLTSSVSERFELQKQSTPRDTRLHFTDYYSRKLRFPHVFIKKSYLKSNFVYLLQK